MGRENTFRSKSKIEEQKADAVAKMKAEGIEEPRNLEEQAISLIGVDIYELIKGYTEKQWGRPLHGNSSFIIKRLPVRFVYDNNYFNDQYQGIPKGGYNKLIEGLLEGIEVRLDVDFLARREEYEALGDKILFTGAIDEFYGYQFGEIGLQNHFFEHEIYDTTNWQGNAVVNYTEAEVPYTRIIEHKHFEMFGEAVENCPKTVVSKEYSTEWKDGMFASSPTSNTFHSKLIIRHEFLALRFQSSALR